MHEVKLSGDQFLDLAQAILSAENSLKFRVRGCSMHPFIQDGDTIEIQPVNAHQIHIGDVILFRTDSGRLLAHRVVGFRRNFTQRYWLLQGDALYLPDGWVANHQVLGRAFTLSRNNQQHRLDTLPWRFIYFGMALGLPILKRVRRKITSFRE